MEPKIMILGGGLAQLRLIKNAKRIGLCTIVVGIEGDYPGYKHADKVYNVDINDKNKVLEIALKENINGISMCCSDFGLRTLGFVCDKLSLQGLSENAAMYSSNKLEMKRRLMDNNIPTSKFVKIIKGEIVDQKIKYLNYPLIVKAVDLQGSKGIFKSENLSEVIENVNKVFLLSKKEYCIIEEFIEGEEFGAQAFIQHGKLMFVQSHGDVVFKKNGLSVPIGHYMPYYKDSLDLSTMPMIVEKAAKSLEMDNCAINVDFIVKDRQIFIIELTGRAGANQLPEVINKYYGINYYEFILQNALGKDLSNEFDKMCYTSKYVISRQLYSNTSSKVIRVNTPELDENTDLNLFIGVGSEIRKFTNSQDCIGQVICADKDFTSCKLKLKQILDSVKIVTDQGLLELDDNLKV